MREKLKGLRNGLLILLVGSGFCIGGSVVQAGIVEHDVGGALTPIDFDGDGKPDISFISTMDASRNILIGLNLAPAGAIGNAFDSNAPSPQDPNDPVQLIPPHLIGASDTFKTGNSNVGELWSQTLVNSGGSPGFIHGGNFFPGLVSYVGLELVLGDGQVHYGWLHCASEFNGVPGFSVIGYAYESSPGVAIAAGAVPEPASFGVIVLAAIAGICRRRERARS